MTNKLLTVAIPTYNGGNALIEAVESCKNINLDSSEFEILVIDNCSNDNSIEILKTNYTDFTSLRIVKNSVNVGRIPNWNKCIEHSDGEYLLYLFANDLIAKDNHVKQTLDFFDLYPESSICSVPWIVSDFKIENTNLASQYFKRTPGVGSFSAESHIKKIIESGKLPYVCLQSNFLRITHIKNSGIRFNHNFSITSDGIFLSQLAMVSNQTCFFDKYSIIWRQDAPNRLHSNVDICDHMKQFYESFLIINSQICKDGINVSKAFANYQGYKYFLIPLLKLKSKENLIESISILKQWISLGNRIETSRTIFYTKTFMNIIKTIIKKLAWF